jgi:hypothetical protein
MNEEDRARVIHGQVRYKDEWIPLEDKARREIEFRRRVEQGYVLDNGEWITIADKISRAKPAQQQPNQLLPFSNAFPNTNPLVSGAGMQVQPAATPPLPAYPAAPVPQMPPYPAQQQPPQQQSEPQKNISFSQYLNQRFTPPEQK